MLKRTVFSLACVSLLASGVAFADGNLSDMPMPSAAPVAQAPTNSDLSSDSVKTPASKAIVVDGTQRNFVVSLPANATTGYQWFVRSYDHDLLQLATYQYNPPSNSKMMGAPGTAQFTFIVRPAFLSAPQATDIVFINARPWDTSQSSLKTVMVVSSAVSSTQASSGTAVTSSTVTSHNNAMTSTAVPSDADSSTDSATASSSTTTSDNDAAPGNNWMSLGSGS